MTTPRHLFIGDVHGCADELQALLSACVYRSSSDVVCLVGDLVAKGPASGEVVRIAREASALAVRGNHDERLLTHRQALLNGSATSVLKPHHQLAYDQLAEADWQYLEALPDYRRFPSLNVIMVHAGLVPGTALEQQRRDLLHNLRTITANGEGSKRHEDGTPWAKSWRGPERVVFGHDAVLGLQQEPFATGLDTGCCYGRSLTALILPEDVLVSVRAARVYT